MKSERGALVRGSDPPSGHSVHKTTGDRWWVPARCLIQTHLGAAVYQQATKVLDVSLIAKNSLFSSLGEERRTRRATSRPLHHGSTWYLRGLYLYSMALPDTNRVDRGFPWCRDRRPIVAWAVFAGRFKVFNVKEQVLPRTAAWTNNP